MLPAASAETLPGWEARVYKAMHGLPTFWGVPQTFGVFTFLGTLLVGLYWWPGLLLGALAWGIAWIGTAVEPRWLAILLEYPGATTYEA